MVKGVVSHLMALLNYLVIQVVITQNVLAYHKKGGLCIEATQRFEDKRCRLGYRTVVESKIYRVVVLVHTPQGMRVNPSQKLGRLFDKHVVMCVR